MRTRLSAALAALLLPAALFAACGDDDDDATPTPAPATATSATGSPTARPTGPAATATATRPAASPTTPSASPTATLAAGGTAPVTFLATPAGTTGQVTLKDVRIGTHEGYDRLVFEFDRAVPAGRVEYVSRAFACGSGKETTPAGNAILQVRFSDAVAHTENGQVTVPATSVAGPAATIRGAEQTCDFEAVVSWVAGIKGRQNFVVSTLQSPPRLVIDIQQ